MYAGGLTSTSSCFISLCRYWHTLGHTQYNTRSTSASCVVSSCRKRKKSVFPAFFSPPWALMHCPDVSQQGIYDPCWNSAIRQYTEYCLIVNSEKLEAVWKRWTVDCFGLGKTLDWTCTSPFGCDFPPPPDADYSLRFSGKRVGSFFCNQL